jgi:hypothetical protein
MFGYDPALDPARHNPGVHYRLYLSPHGEGAVVICVQDFDYRDYEDARFLSYESFTTEAEAQDALARLKADAAKVLGLQVHYVLGVPCG